jgi:pimeloyl-ACP methyl ester carboxylesterase
VTSSGERIADINGVARCVESFGDPADPAIVLLHGAGSSMIFWDDELCARLAAGERFVIRYDSRDAGRSVTYPAGAPPYTGRDLQQDAIGVLDHHGVERAHLLGMSGGAAMAQLLALDHPERVATLILASSTPSDGGDHPDLPAPSPELVELFSGGVAEPDWGDREAVSDYLVDFERRCAARSRPFDADRTRGLVARALDRSADPEANAKNPYLAGGDPWRERLGEIRAPTLVIHGTEDPLFPFGHAEALVREIPGAELLPVERMGHEYFPREAYDLVVPAILRHTGNGADPPG